jgi:superfamily II DNA/RNA helicase
MTKKLQGQGWPAAFIAGDLPQRERLRVFDALMDVSIRVLVSTDLTSRGIDCETVDLVINMDVR